MTGSSRVATWSNVQWITLPRWLIMRWPGLRGVAGDGHAIVAVPPVAAALLPLLSLAAGLICGLFRLGYQDVYTESTLLLALLVTLGAFSSQLGVLAVVGLCVGDFVSQVPSQRESSVLPDSSLWFSGPLGAGPLATVAHQWVPLIISYLLLAAGVVLLPRAARAVVGSVGQGRQVPPWAAWALVSGLLTVIMWLGMGAWVAAAPTLIRPVFTWATSGGLPTTQAMSGLQESGGVVVAAAVVATLARQGLIGWTMLPGPARDRLRAAEQGAPVIAGSATAPTTEPGPARRALAAVAMSGLATLTMAGILEHGWLWVVAFAVLLAIRLARTGQLHVPRLQRWQHRVRALPAWVRLIALWVISQVIGQRLSNNLIGSYTALAVFVLVSILVVFALFPGEPPPRPGPDPLEERGSAPRPSAGAS